MDEWADSEAFTSTLTLSFHCLSSTLSNLYQVWKWLFEYLSNLSKVLPKLSSKLSFNWFDIQEGYIKDANDACVDENECDTGNSQCPLYSSCTNTKDVDVKNKMFDN